MPLTGTIQDRLEIQELYARYAAVSSRSDAVGWLACWADDAVWSSHIFDCHGKAAIKEQYAQVMTAFETIYFSGQAGTIEITGESAFVQTQAMEIGQLKDGGFFKLAGIYDDRVEKRDGEWLFVRRNYRPLVENF